MGGPARPAGLDPLEQMHKLSVLGAPDLRAPDGRSIQSVLAQPKRLALLAYLAIAAPGTFVRRDTLLALFWPELDDARARAALRKALHYLRAGLGADVVNGRGADEVGIDVGKLECDVVELRRLATAGRHEDAVACYTGELLPGFHIDAAPAFDQWLESEREALRQTAAQAATAAALDLAATDSQAASVWQRRAHEIAPDDEEILRETLRLLMVADRRSAAVALFGAYRSRMEELGDEPDASMENLLRRPPRAPLDSEGPRVHASGEPATMAPAASQPSGGAAVESGIPVLPAARPQVVRWKWLRTRVAGVGALAVVLALGVAGWLLFRSELPAESGAPLVAVGAITDFTGGADSLGMLIPDLLATNMARAPHVRVLGQARIGELLAIAGDDASSPVALASAARRGNAQELVEGALYRLPDGELRLDLRRVRLSDGELLETYRVVGRSPFEVVDRATAELVASFGSPPGQPLHIADVTSSSIVALRFYQEGLNAYFRADAAGALGLFEAALNHDSTFAMAAYYAGLASISDSRSLHRYLSLADSLADRATERERLLIRGTLLHYREDPARVAVADSLVSRYPEDPAGHLLLGRSLLWAGHFREALTPLRRAVELDSAALGSNRGPCTACEALVSSYEAYTLMDSTHRAEEAARRLHLARPGTHSYMLPLAQALHANGQHEESDRMVHRAGEAGLSSEWLALTIIGNRIRRGEFDEADAALRSLIAISSRHVRGSARWLLVISLRTQGRLEEALAVVAQEEEDTDTGGGFPDTPAIMQATVWFDRGDYRQAATAYAEIVADVSGEPGTSVWSRNTAWFLTQEANAHAGAGNLARLIEIADSVRTIGPNSAYGRDPRLHHHVRGLHAAATGDHERAVREFRAAVFSIASGYTRTNVELARSLLALGMAAEAAAVLDPPLRNGGLESTLLYATRTEMQALLAEAHDAMGDRERAQAVAARALHAWRRADPQFGPLIERLRQIMAAAPGQPRTE